MTVDTLVGVDVFKTDEDVVVDASKGLQHLVLLAIINQQKSSRSIM